MAKRKPLVFEGGEIIESRATDTMDLNNGVITAAGGNTERKLKDILGDVINVKDYGAKGDGSTDDTAAFQAAQEAAAAKGGVVYVPHGTYKVTENVPGEYISYGHPAFVGAGKTNMESQLTDLYNDYVHKLKNKDESITGVKNFESSPTMPTPAAGDNSTKGATTAFVKRGIDNLKSGNNVWTGENRFEGDTIINNLQFPDDPDVIRDFLAQLLAAEPNGFVNLGSSNKKLRVNSSEFVKANSGLTTEPENSINKLKINIDYADGSGGLAIDDADPYYLKVDFSKLPDEEVKKILERLIDPNGGLAFRDEGLYVDFSQMDDSKFTDLLDSLNLPYYVDGVKIEGNFFVNPNLTGDANIGVSITIDNYPKGTFPDAHTVYTNTAHTKGTYTPPLSADEESYFIETTQNGKTVLSKKHYGWDENHPWKSIKYAADILARKYNINTQTINVYVSEGTYVGTVTCAQQTRSTGSIHFIPKTDEDTVTISVADAASYNCITHTGGAWHFWDMDIVRTVLPQTQGVTKFPYLIQSTSQEGVLAVHNCNYSFVDNSIMKESGSAGGYSARLFYANGGKISIYGNSKFISPILARDMYTGGEEDPTTHEIINKFPRLCVLNSGSIIKAGSILNGQAIASDLTLTTDHTIRNYTKLAVGSKIKGGFKSSSITRDGTTITIKTPNGSSLIAGTTINSTDIATLLSAQYGSTNGIGGNNIEVVQNNLVAQDITISVASVIPCIPLVLAANANPTVNYRSKFYGYQRYCTFASGTTIEAQSIINGTTYNSDTELDSPLKVYSCTLKPGSSIAAGSFLVPARENYGPRQENTNLDVYGKLTSAKTITGSDLTFTGSDALSVDWFYADDGGQVSFNNSSQNLNGYNFANYAFTVEGQFDIFYHLMLNSQVFAHGTGLTTFYLFDPNTVKGKRYQIGSGASMVVMGAADYVDRDSIIPGDIAPTSSDYNTKAGCWISPVDPD